VRKADPFFADISAKKADDDLLGVAEELIKRKTAPFDATAFKNHYTQALRQLVEQRIKGKAPKVETEDERPSGDNVIDLMSALKRSLEGGGHAKAGAKSSARAKGRASRKPAAKSRARKKPAQKARKSA
jgi:DNA end-binding protein Ku